MLLSCGVGEDSWESLGLQGDPTVRQVYAPRFLSHHNKDLEWWTLKPLWHVTALGSWTETKRRLLLGRKVMTNLDSIFKSRNITLPTKVCLVKSCGYEVIDLLSLLSRNSQTQFSSVQFCRSVVSDSLRPHESQHARPPCPSPTPGVHSDSHPLSQWCHPAISSSVIPFSSCPQSLPASESFPMSQLFAWGG